MMDLNLSFEKIIPTSSQIETLYQILSQRDYFISNESSTTFIDHERFVINHPYRRWYLVYEKEHCVGSFYIHYDNSIGINFVTEVTSNMVDQILIFTRKTLKPLKPIPSVRYKNFFLNVPMQNKKLQQILDNLGHTSTQISFILKE